MGNQTETIPQSKCGQTHVSLININCLEKEIKALDFHWRIAKKYFFL